LEAIDLTVWLALGAGFLSFISPCCLPLYPSFISYITGVSVKDLQTNQGFMQKRAMLHTLFFILGFSSIFFALGLQASWFGSLFSERQELIRQLGGILIVVMGLFMIGLINPSWMMREKRFQLQKRPIGYVGSVLVGMTYAAGWTPCVGPILASVLILGSSEPSKAIFYITAYTLGFAIPFFLMAFFIGKVRWIQKYSKPMMILGGVIMILTGILLYTGQLTQITIYLIKLYGGFTGF
jgi:cytochrome c-type biogenesis protein